MRYSFFPSFIAIMIFSCIGLALLGVRHGETGVNGESSGTSIVGRESRAGSNRELDRCGTPEVAVVACGFYALVAIGITTLVKRIRSKAIQRAR